MNATISSDLIDLDNLWIDVLGFTKKDWQLLDTLTEQLTSVGCFQGDFRKCYALALSIWVTQGNGLREETH